MKTRCPALRNTFLEIRVPEQKGLHSSASEPRTTTSPTFVNPSPAITPPIIELGRTSPLAPGPDPPGAVPHAQSNSKPAASGAIDANPFSTENVMGGLVGQLVAHEGP